MMRCPWIWRCLQGLDDAGGRNGSRAKVCDGPEKEGVTLLLGMRSRSSVVGVGVVLAGLSAGWAQQGTRAVATPLPVVTGSVTGRVICSDTNGPARFANVILQPVVGPKPVLTEKQGGGTEQHETMKIVQTGLDGSFSISKVRPGVIAEKAGYRSSLEISREEMDHPSEQVAKKMAAC